VTEAATGEPRHVKCPSCGKEFSMARFYGGKAAVACPWCLAPVKVD
jgi:endogenous inhibitor of DNA gyrase (YacG/DUF329 family)